MLLKNQEDLPSILLIKWLKKKVTYIKSKTVHLQTPAGHEMVRLPVAHCELNPIEKAWSQVKGYVKESNKKYGVNK